MAKSLITPVSIDYSIIEELKSLDDENEPSGLPELLDLFIQETEKRIILLSQFLKNHDFKGMSDLTHSLKSSAASVGASLLAEIAGKMEPLTKFSDFNDLDKLFAQFKTEFSKVKPELLNIKKT
jgi:HPt (histidine-containing phosphotransfer) domain-containing protein